MANLGAAALFGAYRLVGFAVLPAVPLILARRAARGKEDWARLAERYGHASEARPPGRLVWVHAASVGETNAVMPVVRRIVEQGLSVVFTSVTVTAAKIAAAALPKGAAHQFSPLDISPFIGRFLVHWRPDLALFVESELWPTTMTKLATKGIPQILLNARLSERSYRGWHRFGRAAHALFSRITLCLAQSASDGERYRALGAPYVEVTGNLKFDAPPLTADQGEVAAFRAATEGRPVWVAASTHEGEDEVVARADRLLRGRYPNLLTVIAPRHPSRGAAICAAIANQGLLVARRSVGEPVGPATEVYVADTLGELGLFYRVAPIAFLGGSLTSRGGQNPIEPVRLGAAVLHGPRVLNFEEVYGVLDQATGSKPVTDPETLAEAVACLIDAPAARDAHAAAATAALGPSSGALDRTMQALQPFLSGTRRREPATP